jgi:ferredoxin
LIAFSYPFASRTTQRTREIRGERSDRPGLDSDRDAHRRVTEGLEYGPVKVRVDPQQCTGHGRCYELAPEVFGEDEQGHCRIENERVPRRLEESARLGAVNCPEKAISIHEDESVA